jgi:hypothetical protein
VRCSLLGAPACSGDSVGAASSAVGCECDSPPPVDRPAATSPPSRSVVDAFPGLFPKPSCHVGWDGLLLPVAEPHPRPPVDPAAEGTALPSPPHPGVEALGVGGLLLSSVFPNKLKAEDAAPIIPPTLPVNAPPKLGKEGNSPCSAGAGAAGGSSPPTITKPPGGSELPSSAPSFAGAVSAASASVTASSGTDVRGGWTSGGGCIPSAADASPDAPALAPSGFGVCVPLGLGTLLAALLAALLATLLPALLPALLVFRDAPFDLG